VYVVASTVDTSLLSNIQKLFSEKIEIFSPVDFTKVSVLTGIIKISLKVRYPHSFDSRASVLHCVRDITVSLVYLVILNTSSSWYFTVIARALDHSLHWPQCCKHGITKVCCIA